MSPGRTRPRRSASMSEARGDDVNHGHHQQYLRATAARGARRVTLEEKIRQEQELLYQSGAHLRTSYSDLYVDTGINVDGRPDSYSRVSAESFGSDELERKYNRSVLEINKLTSRRSSYGTRQRACATRRASLRISSLSFPTSHTCGSGTSQRQVAVCPSAEGLD